MSQKLIIIGPALRRNLEKECIHFLGVSQCESFEINARSQAEFVQEFLALLEKREDVHILFSRKIPRHLVHEIRNNNYKMLDIIKQNNLVIGYFRKRKGMIQSIVSVISPRGMVQSVFEVRKRKREFYRKVG